MLDDRPVTWNEYIRAHENQDLTAKQLLEHWENLHPVQESFHQPQQGEWWGTDQPAGQPGGIGTSSETPLFDHPSSQHIAGHPSQQDTGVDMRTKLTLQSFSLTDGSSSEEEDVL